MSRPALFLEVKLMIDRETGQSRGFGFVTMGNVSEGNAAIKGLEARPKDDRGGALLLFPPTPAANVVPMALAS